MDLPALRHLVIDRPLAALDLAATGPDPATARIVEVAVLRMNPGGRPAVPFCRHLDPGVPIPAAATAAHGLADQDVAGEPTFRRIAPALRRFLAGCDLAGFGIARYHLPLLAAEFGRCGLRFPLGDRRVLDARAAYHRFRPRTLAAAVPEYLGREHEAAHTAADDAAAALAVVDAQVAAHGLPADPAGWQAAVCPADVGGWFDRTPGGGLAFARGRHRGRPLGAVAAADPGYLRRLLGRPLLDDAARLVRDALGRSDDTD